MSHEEPDLELPKEKQLQKELVASGLPPPTGEMHGEITWQSLLSGLIVAAIMGVSYPYMVLKLGFGPNVSVVAAFFGFLFLQLLDKALRRRHYNRWQNNLVEAAGTSAAQTAFMCVLLGAFDMLAYNTRDSSVPFAMELTPFTSFLWLTAAATLGVLLAVPLRRHFVVDEKLPYVDGMAAGETVTVLDPPRGASPEVKKNALLAFTAMMIGVVISGLAMGLREDARFTDLIPHDWRPEVMLIGGLVLAKLGVGVAFSFLSIGSGMLVGLRITVSMMLGAIIAWIVLPYILVDQGIPLRREITDAGTAIVFTDAPTRDEVLFWVMWPATGMLVAGGLTALVLRWKILVATFRSLRAAKVGGSEFPLQLVVPGIAISAIALCIIQLQLLGMPIWMTLTAILLSIPLMLVGLRVLGETNWGPISALSNMMQGLFAAVAPGNIGANMVASGTTGTIATSSEMIMQDYRAGEIVGTRPRLITIMQLLAVPVGAAAVSWMYPVFVETYGLVGPDAQLSSPISAKWAGFAQILRDGISALDPLALKATVVGAVLGIVLTVLESNKRIKKWVPSPTGIGIGMLVPFFYIATMFIGGVIGWIWEKANKKAADLFMIPLASGFIAGEALVAVFGGIYFFITE